MLFTKITAAQNEATLSYHRVRGLYSLAIIFVATIAAINSLYHNEFTAYKVIILFETMMRSTIETPKGSRIEMLTGYR